MIKSIILGILLLLPSISYARTIVELEGPGITWHVIGTDAESKYDNKISSDGRLISTPELGIKYTSVDIIVYNSLAVFTADNSIGSTIYGAIGSTGICFSKYLNMGVAYGGYIQNNRDFYNLGIQPFSLVGDQNAFVPLLGFEVDVKYYLSEDTFLGFNNLVTPLITNHNISIGIRY